MKNKFKEAAKRTKRMTRQKDLNGLIFVLNMIYPLKAFQECWLVKRHSIESGLIHRYWVAASKDTIATGITGLDYRYRRGK